MDDIGNVDIIRKVEDDMKRALENKEFKVYLQPKYSTKEEKLSGAEVLVRWIHPAEGFRDTDEDGRGDIIVGDTIALAKKLDMRIVTLYRDIILPNRCRWMNLKSWHLKKNNKKTSHNFQINKGILRHSKI